MHWLVCPTRTADFSACLVFFLLFRPRRLEHSRLLKWSQRVAKERRFYHREGFCNDTQRVDKEVARVRLAYALEAAATELPIDGGKYGTPSYRWMFQLNEVHCPAFSCFFFCHSPCCGRE